MLKNILMYGAVTMGLMSSAVADESTKLLAINGDWAAVAYKADSTDVSTTVCSVLYGSPFTVIIRVAYGEGFELRVADEGWVLPPHVDGDLTVTVDDTVTAFPITNNVENMVGAPIAPDALDNLLHSLKIGHSLFVKVGNFDERTVSLSGIGDVLPAFEKCVEMLYDGQ